jgi:hypothetical protein
VSTSFAELEHPKTETSRAVVSLTTMYRLRAVALLILEWMESRASNCPFLDQSYNQSFLHSLLVLSYLIQVARWLVISGRDEVS